MRINDHYFEKFRFVIIKIHNKKRAIKLFISKVEPTWSTLIQNLMVYTLAMAWFSFSPTQKEVEIGIFADYGLTGHWIGEKQSPLRVPTL